MGESTGLVTIAVAVLTLIGTIAVPLISKIRNRPVKKDRVELFFERYDKDRANDRQDISNFRKEVARYRQEAEEARTELDDLRNQLSKALTSLDEREGRINILERKIAAGNVKYANLLRRFNNANKKLTEVEKAQK